jgi:3-amino-5-hydroxybenzoate synthase
MNMLKSRDWPKFGIEEEKALYNALHQGGWWRQSGAFVKKFEDIFSSHEEAYKTIAVTNGTHALELALLSIDVKHGDEVIIPAITFFSTASAVQKLGAIPVLCDVVRETYNIDPYSVSSLINEKTKAIIAVNMAGQLVEIDMLKQIVDKYNIHLIIDAAHSPGAKWKESGIGQCNAITTYSFQNSKILTCGEGGAVTFPSHELYEKGYIIHNCGRKANDIEYRHTEIGSNYRMNEFSASILIEQLKKQKVFDSILVFLRLL